MTPKQIEAYVARGRETDIRVYEGQIDIAADDVALVLEEARSGSG